MTALSDLRGVARGQGLSSGQVFEAIFEAGALLSDSGGEADDALEIAIRLLEARRTGQLPDDCKVPVEFLAEECGLYPYIDPGHFDFITQSLLEAHSVELRGKLYLHAKQMQVLLWLLGGDNVILSAPTSFGKSLLVDAFIARKLPHTIVMILPTIALIDECRRRLISTFGNKYVVIPTSTEDYDKSKPTIFILTQERFLQRKDVKKIDFLFVDEFYKLDPTRDDGRFETLNLALYKALPRAKQCFMAGPHIREISLGERWKGNFRFVRTDYRTVTVNVIDRSATAKRFQAFLDDLKSVGDESSLVFTATPGTAQTLMNEMLAAGVSYKTDLGPKLAGWIEANYHKNWPVAKGCESGLAVHHGRLPRSLGQLFVHLFDEGVLKVLICTSTLIEGVNTSAANVFIYDKKINRTDFDFFSFANIRGRVGRMMRHFVGSAFLYHSPPEEIETHVDVPMLSDPSTSSDFLLVNANRDELSRSGKARQDAVINEARLPASILRDYGAMGLPLLAGLLDQIQATLSRSAANLIWSGFPDKEQRIEIATLCLYVAHARKEQTGIHTGPQVGWAWSQLKSCRTLPSFLRWFAKTFSRKDEAEGIDKAFQFLQACEFSFPRSMGAIEAIVKHLRPNSNVSYMLYVASVENWFRPAWIKQLDEAGVPIPLSERIAPLLKSPSNRAEAINKIRQLNLNSIAGLDDIDRFILRQAIS